MKHSFGRLLSRTMYFGPSGNGSPCITDGDTARVLFFANLSGAYNGNAGAVQAKADLDRIAHCANVHDELVAALRVHHEWAARHHSSYSEHGEDAVAYRATAALLSKESS